MSGATLSCLHGACGFGSSVCRGRAGGVHCQAQGRCLSQRNTPRGSHSRVALDKALLSQEQCPWQVTECGCLPEASLGERAAGGNLLPASA